MGLAAMRKSDDGDDPRASLRQAIAACAAVHAKGEQHQQAVHRARNMLGAADAKLSLAGEALEATRTKHAEAIAQAALSGTVPKGTELRSARQALADAEDEAAAAKAALDRLDAYGDNLDASGPSLENAVLVAVSEVVAPAAEQILTQIRQKQIELLVLRQAFHTLTDEQTTDIPMFGSDVKRLNAKDARMKPVAQLRNEFFALNTDAGQERAKEAAGAWRKWRESLRRDPDAPAPEV